MRKRILATIVSGILLLCCGQFVLADEVDDADGVAVNTVSEITHTEEAEDVAVLELQDTPVYEEAEEGISDAGVIAGEDIAEVPEETEDTEAAEKAEEEELLENASAGEVTITFQGNGGTFYGQRMDWEEEWGTTQKITFSKGERILSKAPNSVNPYVSREGYAFNGWFTDVQCKNPLSTNAEATSNMTLYAGWTTDYYTVTFDPADGNQVYSFKTNSSGQMDICVRKNRILGDAISHFPPAWSQGMYMTTKYTYTRGGTDYVSPNDKITHNTVVYASFEWNTASVSYRTHVQSIGWQGWKKDGDMSGTTGQSKRLEAININVSNLPYAGGITYRTHVQKYGWQTWKSNGEMAGTSGEGKRLEAIQIQLTGEMAKHYDVYYQTHIQHFGWSGWASNGEMCGSAGYAYRLEGIRIKLVKKGEAAPGSMTNPFYGKAGSGSPVSKVSGALVGYNTHVQTYGWQNFVYDGAMSGTSGQSKRLEGIQINLVDKPYRGDIVYRTHVQKYGWQAWKKNGQMSGTSGEAKRLEGIQIYLTGEMAKHYDVYYRVHAQTYGWLDYAKNGQMAGTSGLAKRLEGINIVLVPKGGKAPGSTARPNVVGGGGKLPDNPYKE